MSDPRPGDGMDAVRGYWDKRAAESSSDCERVESGVRGQRMRFEAFLSTHDLSGRSVLDVGCGVGDFYARLTARGAGCEYQGVDVSAEMVTRARARFPGARFDVRDITSDPPAARYDFTTAFAIHNVRVPDGPGILRRVLESQFEAASIAAHMSLLTDRYQGFDPHIQAWRAEEILALALSLTPFVVLRHDYLPNDFSVTLYRQPLIDTRPDLVADL